jgi:hypothetical protein
LHRRHSRKPLDHIFVKLFRPRLCVMLRAEVQEHHHLLFHFESRVHFLSVSQAMNKKPRPDESNQRKRNLNHHQHPAKPVPSRASCRISRAVFQRRDAVRLRRFESRN